MLRLAWPLVMTNIAGTLMTATDVIMLGRLSSSALAASALGNSLYFSVMISGLGIVLATAPMLAKDLGENRFAVRELRRTVRQGLWTSLALCLPLWLVLWNTELILSALGQERGACRAGRNLYARAAMGGAAVLRLHCPALVHLGAGASGLGARHRTWRCRLQRAGQLVPGFWQFRLSRAWHCRVRPCHLALLRVHVSRPCSCRRHATGASAATGCSAASGGPTGSGWRSSGGSACPSASS